MGVMRDGLRVSAPGSVVVMNPSSGPGPRSNSDYRRVLAYCQNAGQKVIGYVSTRYGGRSERLVKADVDAYYKFYPSIDGIFFDEMATDPGSESHYKRLHDHVKTKSGTRFVSANPGTATSESSWQLRTADNVVVFEGYQWQYEAWQAPAWTTTTSASRISHLVHASRDTASLNVACTKAQETNAGFVYVTDDGNPDDGDSNPWDELPTYWSSELQVCYQQSQGRRASTLDRLESSLATGGRVLRIGHARGSEPVLVKNVAAGRGVA